MRLNEEMPDFDLDLMGAEGAPTDEWPEPDALHRSIQHSNPYPMDALGSILGPAARAISAVVQSADATIGGSMLASASLAAMPHVDVLIDGRRLPIGLFFMTIASSGERKSSTDAEALRVHKIVEREKLYRFERDTEEHNFQMESYEENKKKRGKKNGHSLSPRDEPTAPINPTFITREPTLEGLHKLLLSGPGYAGLMSDEGGEFFGGYAMGKDQRVRTVAAISSLWDRGEFDRVRAGDGINKYWGRRIAAHMMIQPAIAEQVLSDRTMTNQGFLARFLLAWPEERAGTRHYVERDLTQDPAMLAYWGRMRELLEWSPRMVEGRRNELDPVTLAMDGKAKAVWIKIADAFERSMAMGESLNGIKAWASKAAEQVLRVAGVLTVVENQRPTHIDVTSIERAAKILTFHMGEAARIVGTASVPPNIRNAEAVISWLHQNGRRIVFSGEIIQRGPTCVRHAVTLRSAMDVLERQGYVRRMPEGTIIDGKARKSAWEVCPADEFLLGPRIRSFGCARC